MGDVRKMFLIGGEPNQAGVLIFHDGKGKINGNPTKSFLKRERLENGGSIF